MRHQQIIHSVSIIGFGNLAFHLTKRLLQQSILVDQIYNRTPVESPWESVSIIHDLNQLLPCSDLYIICVSDDAIAEVSKQLSLYIPPGSLVCHCSGSNGLEAIDPYFYRASSLYPLQSFTKGQTLDWGNIPVIVHSKAERDRKRLYAFAKKWAHQVYSYNDDQKAVLHLAAVLANNFTNALVGLSFDLLTDHEINPKILSALLEQTFTKIRDYGPMQSQTGPAIRGDQKTIDAHLSLLRENKEIQKLYRMMTDIIARKKRNS